VSDPPKPIVLAVDDEVHITELVAVTDQDRGRGGVGCPLAPAVRKAKTAAKVSMRAASPAWPDAARLTAIAAAGGDAADLEAVVEILAEVRPSAGLRTMTLGGVV
jgi:hypothetical protein